MILYIENHKTLIAHSALRDGYEKEKRIRERDCCTSD